MNLNTNRLHIFTGHYGSGKTEVAINFAVMLKKSGKNVTIVDLDIVNPYFRTKDAEKPLTDLGIKVIAPTFANTNLDLPSLPSDIYSVFHDKDSVVIFDVGGDEDGAIALGRFNAYFMEESYSMYLVVNPNRPLNKTPEEIIETLQGIEQNSRLKIHYFVNNSNIMQFTTVETLSNGQIIIDKATKRTGIETTFTAATEKFALSMPQSDTDILKLKLYLKPYWLKEGE